MDFIVIMIGLLLQLNIGINLSALRVLRLLKPLASISKIKEMEIIVSALIASIPGLSNLLVFLLFITMVFAIFGLHLYSGMFQYRCRESEFPVNGSWKPVNNKLCNP